MRTPASAAVLIRQGACYWGFLNLSRSQACFPHPASAQVTAGVSILHGDFLALLASIRTAESGALCVLQGAPGRWQ